jgi:hypothetical protein
MVLDPVMPGGDISASVMQCRICRSFLETGVVSVTLVQSFGRCSVGKQDSKSNVSMRGRDGISDFGTISGEFFRRNTAVSGILTHNISGIATQILLIQPSLVHNNARSLLIDPAIVIIPVQRLHQRVIGEASVVVISQLFSISLASNKIVQLA